MFLLHVSHHCSIGLLQLSRVAKNLNCCSWSMYVCVSINVIVMQHTVYIVCTASVISNMLMLWNLVSTATSDNILTTTVTVTSVQVNFCVLTALTAAAQNGHVEVVQMLLQSEKVHVDQKDSKVSMLFIIHLPILFMYRIIINECVYSVYLYCSSIL